MNNISKQGTIIGCITGFGITGGAKIISKNLKKLPESINADKFVKVCSKSGRNKTKSAVIDAAIIGISALTGFITGKIIEKKKESAAKNALKEILNNAVKENCDKIPSISIDKLD